MATLRPCAVSIGIPAWNRRPLLQRAVESALAQTYPHIEVIISDDGSTDDTSDYLDTLTDPRIVILRKTTNLGLVANFNTCLQAATSEFLLILNDDDWLLPTAIEKLVTAFLHPPRNLLSRDIGVSWCTFTNVDVNGATLWNVRGGPPIERSVDLIAGLFNGTRGPICSGVMLRTADVHAAGGYQSRYGYLSDVALLGKACLRYPYAACVDEPLMCYQVHQSTGSATGRITPAAWQQSLRLQTADFSAILRSQGSEVDAQLLIRSSSHTLANITTSILLRSFGSPGWVRIFADEFWRSRSFMLTPFVLKRALLDGWKLLRLLRRSDSAHLPPSPVNSLTQSLV
jgi:hypothetical protein